MAHTVLSVQKLNKGNLNSAYKHNSREMEVKNADGELEYLNKELISQNEGKSYFRIIDERLNDLKEFQTSTIRSNQVYAFSVVMSIPEEVKNSINVDAWTTKSMEWLEKEFNENADKYGSNIVSAKLHLDESSPHIHAIIMPIDDKGHLNAYHYIHGPGSMRALHTSYAEAMKEFGLERGNEYSTSKRQTIRQFYSQLNAAESQKAPDIKPGESLESYKKRADEAMSKQAIQYFAKAEKIRQKAEDRISKEHTKTVKAKLELKDATHKIKELEKKLDDVEHELGENYREIKEKVTTVNSIAIGLSLIEDADERERLRQEMNYLIRLGRETGRKKEKKINREI